MEQIIALVLNNPVILGAIIQVLLSGIQQVLVKVDSSSIETQNATLLHNAFLVLSFLATAANLAATGQLHTLDLTTLGTALNYWVPLLLAGKASSVIVKPKPVELQNTEAK